MPTAREGCDAATPTASHPPHSMRAFFVPDSDAFACRTGGASLHIGVVRPVGTP